MAEKCEKNGFSENPQNSTQRSATSFGDIGVVEGAKLIYFLHSFRKMNFGQHLGNTCCLNVAFLLTHFWQFLAIFSELVNKRQHLGNKWEFFYP